MNYEKIKEILLKDSKKTGAIASVVLTLVLAPFMLMVGSNLVSFFTVILVPMLIIGLVREKEASEANLRDWNILNVAVFCWVPLFVMLLALIG